MRKTWQLALAIVALVLLSGIMFNASAQDIPIAGGYAKTSPSDPEVVSAARFAISAQGRKQGARITLVSIDRAEVQVVAGLNYQLWMHVKINGRARNVTAVIYKNLKQRYALTSWETETEGGGGGSASPASTIEELVNELAGAYTSRSLGRLDASGAYLGKVRWVIEHSLASPRDRDRFAISDFNNMASAEQWLRNRETSENVPQRQSRPLVRCRRGVCIFDFNGGILHNNLYLQKIAYVTRRGRPYIRTIYLLDGD